MRSDPEPLTVVVESGRRKVFASVLDFPGWSRSGRDEDAALASLLAYWPRYADVAKQAELPFAAPPVAPETGGGSMDGFWRVTERLPGTATTDFGAPGVIASFEREPQAAAWRARAAALLQACWATFDIVEQAAPRILRKGPRGGGRDTDAIRRHLYDTDHAYAPKVGVRSSEPLAAVRQAVVQAVLADRQPEKSTQWPAAYVARRYAWHALDHAWEIQDRS